MIHGHMTEILTETINSQFKGNLCHPFWETESHKYAFWEKGLNIGRHI